MDAVTECDFCGYQAHLKVLKANTMGCVPGDPCSADQWLCEICRNSTSVSAWLNGLRYSDLAHDMNWQANRMLAEIERVIEQTIKPGKPVARVARRD